MDYKNLAQWSGIGATAIVSPLAAGTLAGLKVRSRIKQKSELADTAKKIVLGVGFIGGLLANLATNTIRDLKQNPNYQETVNPIVQKGEVYDFGPEGLASFVYPTVLTPTEEIYHIPELNITRNVNGRTPQEFIDDVIEDKRYDMFELQQSVDEKIGALESEINYLSGEQL